MKKALVYLGVCALLVIVITQAAIQYFTHQALQTFQERYQSEVDLSVDWVSADFNGVLTFHGFAITPFSLKRTYEAEKVHVYFADYLRLISHLPSLADGGDWSGIVRIRTESGQTELRGKGLDDWLSEQVHPFINTLLTVHACRRAEQMDNEETYRALGIDRLAMDVDLAFNTDRERTDLSAGVDLKERGRIDLYAAMPAGVLPHNLQDIGWHNLAFDSLQISYVENGYYRRISNFCNESSEWSRQGFALIAAQQWQEKLAAEGVRVNDRVAAMYANFLTLGGKISLSMQAENRLQLASWSRYLDRDLVALLGIQVRVNNANVEQLEVRFASEQLLPPAPEAAVATKSPAADQSQAEPVRVKQYVRIPLETTELQPGARIRVVLQDGKRVEGVLESSSERQLVLGQNVKGGRLSFPVKRENIAELSLWQ